MYISAQASIQNKTNPSGSLCSGGPGETRFFINGSVVSDDWPRPQRDGPALRVSALVSYANYLISTGHTDTVKSVIWPIVQNDLSYVSEHWNETTYDLWESLKSSSMFATAVQYRSLVEGNGLAKKLGKQCDNCESQVSRNGSRRVFRGILTYHFIGPANTLLSPIILDWLLYVSEYRGRSLGDRCANPPCQHPHLRSRSPM